MPEGHELQFFGNPVLPRQIINIECYRFQKLVNEHLLGLLAVCLKILYLQYSEVIVDYRDELDSTRTSVIGIDSKMHQAEQQDLD